jgi:hypothetical protein
MSTSAPTPLAYVNLSLIVVAFLIMIFKMNPCKFFQPRVVPPAERNIVRVPTVDRTPVAVMISTG